MAIRASGYRLMPLLHATVSISKCRRNGIEPVLKRLIDSGHGVAGLSIERPGLHEVFVKLVRDGEGDA